VKVIRIQRIQQTAKIHTHLTQQDIRNFIVRFKHNLPGLGNIPQDQTTLNALAQILQVFANNEDRLVQFIFQLQGYLKTLRAAKCDDDD